MSVAVQGSTGFVNVSFTPDIDDPAFATAAFDDVVTWDAKCMLSETFSISSTSVNLLEPSGKFTYHQV
jgi:hypothetical protein